MQISDIAANIWTRIQLAHSSGSCLIMGILNVTPDSFSDGGAYQERESALAHAGRMIREGADIIDIGGESTRPGAASVSEDEELSRVLPVIEALRQMSDIPISIDTQKAGVAKEALMSGANIVNDISALRYDPQMAEVLGEIQAPLVLMHMQGSPETMQDSPVYSDAVGEIQAFFEERLSYCRARGITRTVIDPGIGFGKRLQDNLELLNRLSAFRLHDVPILLGASRKSFIGTITGQDAGNRLGGSIAGALVASMNGASIVRVHDVLHTKSALQVMHAINKAKENTDVV